MIKRSIIVVANSLEDFYFEEIELVGNATKMLRTLVRKENNKISFCNIIDLDNKPFSTTKLRQLLRCFCTSISLTIREEKYTRLGDVFATNLKATYVDVINTSKLDLQ